MDDLERKAREISTAVVGCDGGWAAQFTVGGQTFTVQPTYEDRTEAGWMKDMLDKAIAAIQRDVREADAQVAKDEPELPGPMPDSAWDAIRNDRDACEEFMRIVVRATKKNIVAAIRSQGVK